MSFDISHINWPQFNFEKLADLSLILFCVLFLLFEYFPGRKYFYSLNDLKKFIDRHLIRHLVRNMESRRTVWLRAAATCIVWIMLILALANPRWDFEEVQTAKPNVNLVILLDISKSMDSTDIKPSRLRRAMQEIVDIIRQSKAVNIGLIAFADQAHIISPVTDDMNAIQYLLPSINTDLVGVQGSNIQAGLKSADLLLKPLEGGMNYILIMSDGGFEDSSKLQQFAKTIKNGRILTFGFGGSEGAPIPDEKGKFIKEEGKNILTKLEKENLIALSGLDNYIQLSYLDDDTRKIIKIISSELKTKKQKPHIFKIWHERFYIPLAVAMAILLFFFRRGAVFLLIAAMLISSPATAQDEEIEVTNPEPEKQPEKPDAAKQIPIPETNTPQFQPVAADRRNGLERLIDFLFMNQNQQAKELYKGRSYKESEELFSSPYNKGVSAYRAGKFAEAESYFSQEKDSDINSEYNLGNTQLKQEKIDEAIATYESVLKKDPEHEDAKINLEIARKLRKNSDNTGDKDKPQKQDQDKNNDGQNAQNDQKNSDQKDSKNNKQNDNKDDNPSNDNSSSDKEQKTSPGQQNENSSKDRPDQKNGKAEQDKKNDSQQSKQDQQDNQPDSNSQNGDQQNKESNGKQREKELDIQAKSILSKISSDPSKLMKNRFRYEERSNDKNSEGSTAPKPW